MPIIERVKHEGPADALVWRHAGVDLGWGSQVIVNQSHEAVLVKDGKVLDALGPGTHVLRTAEIPLLRALVAAPFGGEASFAADVYFVNKAAVLEVKWSTDAPLRVFGQFGVCAVDARAFVAFLSAGGAPLEAEELSNRFKAVVLAKAKDYVAATVRERGIGPLEASAHLEEMSGTLKERLDADFSGLGAKLASFCLNSVDLKPDAAR